MAKKDYYGILGVQRTASREEIKKAYKKLAMQFHPDRAPEEKKKEYEEKFKEINEAASILGDESKRQHYDQYGTTADQMGSGFSGFDFSDFANFDFEDIFDQFFSGGIGGIFGGRRRHGPSRGSDLRYDMEVTLEEAASGAVKNIVIPRNERCNKCDGTGAASGSDIKACDVCNGSGSEKRTTRTAFGIFQQTTTCHKCRGQGQIIRHPCGVCDGDGLAHKNRKIEVEIPAGVEDGTQLRVSGEGEAGERGASSGDLYVVTHIKKHDIFERHGNDISIEIPISFATACMGEEIEVPTLKEKAMLKIPSGTQPGTVFRMKGKGIPSLRGYGTGNQNVKVTIAVPEKLSKRQRELLIEFAKEFKDKKGFFGKMF